MAFDPVTAVLGIGGKLIDRLWPDPEKKAAAQLELIKLQQSGELAAIAGQLEINKIEAAHTSVFVSGWRPAVGWISALGLGIQFVVNPLITWASAFVGRPIVFPNLDLSLLLTLLGGMLGLGGLRSYEKVNGVAAR